MTMITHVGDTSNLILDSDLDSFYLMDTTLLALPELQNYLLTVAQAADAILDKEEITIEDRIALAKFEQKLADNKARLSADYSTVFNEDSNFYGVSETLKSQIEPAFANYNASIDELLNKLNMMADSGKSTISAGDFTELLFRARDDSFRLWNKTISELEILLNKRIDNYKGNRRIGYLLTSIVMLLSIFTVYTVANYISSRIAAINLVIQRAIRGDLRQEEFSPANDEIGLIVGHLNSLISALEKALSGIDFAAQEIHATMASQKNNLNGVDSLASNTNNEVDALNHISTIADVETKDIVNATQQLQITVDDIAKSIVEFTRTTGAAVTSAKNTVDLVEKLGLSSNAISNVIELIKKLLNRLIYSH